MTAAAERAECRQHQPGDAYVANECRPARPVHETQRPEPTSTRRAAAWLRQRGGSWPLIVLAAPASVAVWSGWVRLGQLTGFGLVRPFPGLWDSLRVNTAITLPIGVEAYGAYALRAWLDAGPGASDRTRRFAKWSAIGSLLLGMSGQVTYHLLSEARVTRAPWGITMIVACLPVLVLGMGAALAHLRHADAAGGPAEHHEVSRLRVEAQDPSGHRGPPDDDPDGTEVIADRLEFARLTALELTSTRIRISRRALRDAGIKGSNAELSALVKTVTAELAHGAETS